MQAASNALEVHFADKGGHRQSTLDLVRFAAAMQELKDAWEAFVILLGARS